MKANEFIKHLTVSKFDLSMFNVGRSYQYTLHIDDNKTEVMFQGILVRKEADRLYFVVPSGSRITKYSLLVEEVFRTGVVLIRLDADFLGDTDTLDELAAIVDTSSRPLTDQWGWRDVYSSEGQSDPNKEYLLYSNGKYEIGSYYVDVSYDNVAYWHDRNGEVIDIDHYAELPEPPEVKNNDG